MSSSRYYQLSGDAQRALEEFRQDFALALSQAGSDQWANDAGHHVVTDAPRVTFPVPVDAAGYKEFEGEIKYRSLFQKSVSLTPRRWTDGVSELASIIEAPDFIGWLNAPAAMAAAAACLPNQIIADAIAANATCWDGTAFFSDSHPYNVFDSSIGTYDNDFTGAGTSLTAANLKLAKQRFREIKNPGGKPLGLRMTHVMVPPALEETAKDLLEQDLVIQAVGSSYGAVDNRHKGTLKIIVADELSDSSKWYGLALNKPSMKPWVTISRSAPEEIEQGKDSHLYKTTLKVALAYVLDSEGGLLLPQCMHRWAGSA